MPVALGYVREVAGSGPHAAQHKTGAWSQCVTRSLPRLARGKGEFRVCRGRAGKAKPQWEFPRLCRGGSKSLTYPAVDTAAPSTKLRIASRQAHEEGFD